MILLVALMLVAPRNLFGQAAPKVHKLPATPQTVAFGHYSATTKPVLRIASGDIIDVETMITNNPQGLQQAGVDSAEIQQSLRDITTQIPRGSPDRGPGGHILTGPVFVEGAEPGDVLEVRLLSIGLPIAYGYNGCSGFMRELCQNEGAPGAAPARAGTRIFRLDRQRMVSEFSPGIVIPLRPFFGSMGVAPPPDSGRVSSNPPGKHAGNLDNKELVAGTKLFIPVHVAGALFQVGDGHAAQGDGEVNQTAIETSLTGRIQLIVRKDMKLEWPLGETDSHWIAMGADPNLTEATRICIREAVKFLQGKGLPQGEAYRLVSLAVDLRITELVDGNVGVHAMIPKSIFVR
jgi:acetamidase/formamidase